MSGDPLADDLEVSGHRGETAQTRRATRLRNGGVWVMEMTSCPSDIA
jgi:hypothetical protein